MFGLSFLKTRHRLVLRISDSIWFTARLQKLVAYCQGYRRLHVVGHNGDHKTPLLKDTDEGWTSYDAVKRTSRIEEFEMSEQSVAYHQEKLDIIMDSICKQCLNHCSRCVYDCQLRYDEPEEWSCVESDVTCNRGVYEEEVWDNHRALAQVMTASVILQDAGTGGRAARRKTAKKSLRKRSKMVVGGDKITDPQWPAVLLTFDKGISSSFRETHGIDTRSY